LPDRYKCNIDAAFSSHLNCTAWVSVSRIHKEGTFVLAKVISYPCSYSVDVGEVLGLHSAFQWLSDMQFDNVDFETESKLICDVFHAARDDTSEFECIISSCRSLLHSFFTNSRVKFVRRQVNEVAHILAREAMLLASAVVYFNISDGIEPIIINEMFFFFEEIIINEM
jgi:ribonuclease HI